MCLTIAPLVLLVLVTTVSQEVCTIVCFFMIIIFCLNRFAVFLVLNQVLCYAWSFVWF
eukprot:m.103678 g.103678  ORF g.103678 m.103678 type:complete len:58 (+) comp13246_c0_seq1:7051-7224(+)